MNTRGREGTRGASFLNSFAVDQIARFQRKLFDYSRGMRLLRTSLCLEVDIGSNTEIKRVFEGVSRLTHLTKSCSNFGHNCYTPLS